MTLRFIYGQAGYNHDQAILSQIKHDYQLTPNDHYFYLVPNHIKFKSEVNTLKYLNPNSSRDYAQINVQILSFTRLAWFFMSQIPRKQSLQLGNAGINMLLYKIIQKENQDHQLKIFQTGAEQPGFISKLASQINEMKMGQLSPDDLANDLKQATKAKGSQEKWNPDLIRKMHDFVKIYHNFEKSIQGRYLGKADVLTNLCHCIRSRQVNLSNYHFYLSGFSQFTAQENALVKLLITHSTSVLIDLNLDAFSHYFLPDRLPPRPNLFYKSALLYRNLFFFAKEHHVKIIVDKSVKRKRVTSDLLRLDNFWSLINRRHAAIPPEKLYDQKSIQIIRAPTHYVELAKVALMIRQLVARGKYRYSDFLILTRHLDKFKNVIRPIFKAQSIPIFVDLQKSMDTHPLVQLLEALFSIYRSDRQENENYQYSDVMNLLKTELLIPKDKAGHFIKLKTFRNDLAETENWILKTGYRGSEWTKSQAWQVMNYSSDFNRHPRLNRTLTKHVNVIHQFISQILPPFYKRMDNAKNGTEAATILYKFLINNGVLDRLKLWQRHDANPTDQQPNDLTAANEIGQVWKVFCQLLDDFVKILGTHPFNLKDFLGLLKAGFEGSIYSQIPSTLDQVIISESRIVQTNDYRIVFMIGSTDEVMPDKITNDALFNDEDRDEIAPCLKDNQYLNDNSTNKMANEPFLNYLAFMSATQRVIFTYSLNNNGDSDKNVKISPYVKRIENHFQIQEIRVPLSPPANSKEAAGDVANQVINFVGTKQVTLRHLVQAACDSNHDSLESTSMDPNWYYLYTQLAKAPLTNKLLGGLIYNNQPQKLAPKIVTQLYGKNLNTSISQLEQFYQDPFEYFLKYGLRLRKRKVFGLSSIETGRFYHKMMEDFVKLINQHGIKLTQLTRAQINNLVGKITDKILTDPNQPQYRILTSSHRMAFIQHRLTKTIGRMLITMHEQSYYTKMRPYRAETPFGIGQRLAVPKLKVGSHRINLRGRIDRIDAMALAHKNFFSIIDYKSSQHQFDYGPIYYGDEMQMMTYLDILYYNLKQHNRWLSSASANALAGVLYAWIHIPKLKLRAAQTDLQNGNDIEVLRNQKYHNALLVDDPQLLTHLDVKLKPKQRSILYPLKRNQNGHYSKSSSLIKPNDLKLILKRTQDLILKAGQKIYQGDIKLCPIQYKQKSKIQFSPYQTIMQFDPLIMKDQYHKIPKMSLKDLINHLKQDQEHHKL